jgi:hypothetical protein
LENLRLCFEEGVDFIIKRNLRREALEGWHKLAQAEGRVEYSSAEKTVWRGTTYREVEGFAARLRIEYEVTERRVVKGKALLFAQVEVETYWTSLSTSVHKFGNVFR